MNKVRGGSFIKKRKLYPQLKMEINLIPLERLVGSWQQCLNSWEIFYKNTFKENYGYFTKKTKERRGYGNKDPNLDNRSLSRSVIGHLSIMRNECMRVNFSN